MVPSRRFREVGLVALLCDTGLVSMKFRAACKAARTSGLGRKRDAMTARVDLAIDDLAAAESRRRRTGNELAACKAWLAGYGPDGDILHRGLRQLGWRRAAVSRRHNAEPLQR
jgi:hypothetical protein